MKPLINWLLKKLGIYQYVWNQFCDQYPIRIAADTPEVKRFFQENDKMFTDMMIYGMGCVQHIDPKSMPHLHVPSGEVIH